MALIDSGSIKPRAQKEKIPKPDSAKKPEVLPFLSNYDKKTFLYGGTAVAILFGCVYLASKFWKAAHGRFFFGNVSIEALTYNFLDLLYALGILTLPAKQILTSTLYASLIISCLVFLALQVIEARAKIREKMNETKTPKEKKKTQNKNEKNLPKGKTSGKKKIVGNKNNSNTKKTSGK